MWLQIQADPFLQQRGARSRSRFDFAQDDSQPSSSGAYGNGAGPESNLSFAAWADPSGGGHAFSYSCSDIVLQLKNMCMLRCAFLQVITEVR